MWIFLCISFAKNACSVPAGGLEWIWERVQKMVGGYVAWVKGRGWKSSLDEGIQRKDDASTHPGQSWDSEREETFISTGYLKMLTQICNTAVVGFSQLWLLWQQLSRKWLVQHEPSITSLPGWWTSYLKVSEAWWLDWESLPASSPLLLCNYKNSVEKLNSGIRLQSQLHLRGKPCCEQVIAQGNPQIFHLDHQNQWVCSGISVASGPSGYTHQYRAGCKCIHLPTNCFSESLSLIPLS